MTLKFFSSLFRLALTTLEPGDAVIRQLCYYYEYDSRERMVVKQLPGADPVYMVYDNRDRLVLTQDGNLRKDKDGIMLNKWLFIKYDELNRPVMTGIKVYTGTNQAMDKWNKRTLML